MTTTYRIRFEIDTHTDALGVTTKTVVVRSRPGSPCHRDWTIARVPAGSTRLAQFKERVEAMRSARPLTVIDRVRMLAVVWSECQG